MTFLVVKQKLQVVLNFIHLPLFLNKIGTMNKSYLLLRLKFIFRYEINVLKTIR